MSGKPAARVTDPTSCPMPGHGTNPIVSGSPDVLFDGLAAARHNDQSACGAAIVGGVSATVFINGRNAAVQSSTGDHGSIIVGGSGSVIIGDTVTAAPVSAVSAMPNTAAVVAALLPPAPSAPQAAALTGAPAVAALTPTIPAAVSNPLVAAAKILDDFQAAPIKERVFNDPANPIGTPRDPFEKSKIHEQIEARLAKAQGGSLKRFHPISAYPDQKETSLCGPATFFYALLMDRPDLYAKAITELWETGETTIGQLHIKPSHGACNQKTSVTVQKVTASGLSTGSPWPACVTVKTYCSPMTNQMTCSLGSPCPRGSENGSSKQEPRSFSTTPSSRPI